METWTSSYDPPNGYRRRAAADDRGAARRVAEVELTVDPDGSKRRIILRLLLGTETGFTRRLQHPERAMPTRRSQSMLFAGSVPPLFLAVLTLSLPAAAYEAVQVSEGGSINGKVV